MSTEQREVRQHQGLSIAQALSITRAATRIAALPAVASHNWCMLAAQALSDASPRLWNAVSILTTTPENPHPLCSSFGTAPLTHTPSSIANVSFDSVCAELDLKRIDIPLQGVITPAPTLIPSWREPDSWISVSLLSTTGNPVYLLVLTHERRDSGDSLASIAWRSSTLAALSARARTAFSTTSGDIHWLTEREHQILGLLIQGQSVRSIAEHLDRSPHTVHDHVKSLHRKLDASSRGALIARALGHEESPDEDTLTAPLIHEQHADPLAEIKPISDHARAN